MSWTGRGGSSPNRPFLASTSGASSPGLSFSPPADRRGNPGKAPADPSDPAPPIDETTGIFSLDNDERRDYQTTAQERNRVGKRKSRASDGGHSDDEDTSRAATADHVERSRASSSDAISGSGRKKAVPGRGWSTALEEFLGYFKSVELENKGSVARDHLALGMFMDFSAPIYYRMIVSLPGVAISVSWSHTSIPVHQANLPVPKERTFLAWLRTSLAFASIGIAITQLFRLNTSIQTEEPPSGSTGQPRQLGLFGGTLKVSFEPDAGTASDPMQTLRHLGKPLGATFLAASIGILFVGYSRYFQAQKWIIRGKFPASRGEIIAVSFVAFSIMVASLAVVVVVAPAGRNR